jgi:hypothetical protein
MEEMEDLLAACPLTVKASLSEKEGKASVLTQVHQTPRFYASKNVVRAFIAQSAPSRSQLTSRTARRLILSHPLLSLPSPCHTPCLQAYISGTPLKSAALMSDCAFIAQSASRIARGLFAIALAKSWISYAEKVLKLSKMLERRVWWNMCPLRQIGGLTQVCSPLLYSIFHNPTHTHWPSLGSA